MKLKYLGSFHVNIVTVSRRRKYIQQNENVSHYHLCKLLIIRIYVENLLLIAWKYVSVAVKHEIF